MTGDGKQQEARRWTAQDHLMQCASCNHGRSPCPTYRRMREAEEGQATQPSHASGEPNSATWQDAAMKSLDKVIELEAQLKTEFQRGQQAMAEKAAQWCEQQSKFCDNSDEERRWQRYAATIRGLAIRSLAGAEPQLKDKDKL